MRRRASHLFQVRRSSSCREFPEPSATASSRCRKVWGAKELTSKDIATEVSVPFPIQDERHRVSGEDSGMIEVTETDSVGGDDHIAELHVSNDDTRLMDTLDQRFHISCERSIGHPVERIYRNRSILKAGSRVPSTHSRVIAAQAMLRAYRKAGPGH